MIPIKLSAHFWDKAAQKPDGLSGFYSAPSVYQAPKAGISP